MTEGQITVAIAIAGLVCQAVNAWFYLRIRHAILESEQRMAKAMDARLERYATNEACELRHQVAIARRSS
ncbi:MAG: hypothetical protein ACK5AZ_24860 [Bryobacteraceae bacterium]